MDETVGPNESGCPAPILDELTATSSEYALAWRARCRANLLAKKLDRAKPSPKPGQTIIFDEPMRFSDGSDRSRFEVVANPKARRRCFVIRKAARSAASRRFASAHTAAFMRRSSCGTRRVAHRLPVIAAWGDGVDSTAMIVELAERGEPIDMVLFADPGAEKLATYAFTPRIPGLDFRTPHPFRDRPLLAPHLQTLAAL